MPVTQSERKKLQPIYYVALHAIWWTVSWGMVVFNLGVLKFVNEISKTQVGILGGFIWGLALLSMIVFPVLEFIYFNYLEYSLASLTSIVLLSFIFAVITLLVPFLIIPYVLTPLIPLIFESLSPISQIGGLRKRIKIEFHVSLLSFSLIDVSVIVLEVILLQIGLNIT